MRCCCHSFIDSIIYFFKTIFSFTLFTTGKCVCVHLMRVTSKLCRCAKTERTEEAKALAFNLIIGSIPHSASSHIISNLMISCFRCASVCVCICVCGRTFVILFWLFACGVFSVHSARTYRHDPYDGSKNYNKNGWKSYYRTCLQRWTNCSTFHL